MKKNIRYLLLLVVSVIVIIFVNNDYFLYDDEIINVTGVNESFDEVSYGYNGISENHYLMHIKGVVLNGDNKGQVIEVDETRSSSLVYDNKYEVNDKVFINRNADSISLQDFKRDTYVVYIVLIFVVALIIIGRFQGLMAIVSLSVNIFILWLVVYLYLSKGINLIVLSVIATILFTIISLVLSIGYNKKAGVVIISTLVSIFIAALIGVLAMELTHEKGVRMEQIEFLLTPYKQVFISEIIIGGMGAIMDIAITITSTVNELVLKNKMIDKKVLYSSCKEIGKDTMGTMLNVILFTYMCTSIPKYVLFFRNGIGIDVIFNSYLTIDVAKGLIAGIGIVLAIPVTSFISISLIRGNDK